jgi:hypothetical protein
MDDLERKPQGQMSAFNYFREGISIKCSREYGG